MRTDSVLSQKKGQSKQRLIVYDIAEGHDMEVSAIRVEALDHDWGIIGRAG